MIVADCTVLARLLIAAHDPTRTEVLWSRDPAWAAPVLWEAEFASVLLNYERAGRLSVAGSNELARQALKIFAPGTHIVSMERALLSARRSGCSSYDSYYVALAEDLNVKLYTYDKEILKKCHGLAFQP